MHIEDIRRDLEVIADRDVLLFGSYVSGQFRDGSDIDIAVLSHSEDREYAKELKKRIIWEVPALYDISIFETLPTVVKADILQDYQVLFGDPLEIGEYLRKYWKEWQDYEHRLELPSLEQMKQGLSE